MAYILNIETATTNCSVSLSHEGETLVLREDNNANYSHAEKLHVFIDEVIATAKIDKKQLDAIAVSQGPGSYTGLRIGVSAAKGLCYALGIPLIAVDTLKSLAIQVKEDNALIVAMLDARRMEVYSAIYDTSFNLVRSTKAEVLEDHIYNTHLDKSKVIFIGNGVEKAKTIVKHHNAMFIEGKLPSANEMSQLSHEK